MYRRDGVVTGCSEEGMRLVGIRGCRGGLLFNVRFRGDGGVTGCGEEGMRQVGIRGCRACRPSGDKGVSQV